MSEQDDNFLSRWSRRKAQVRQGVAAPAAGAAVVLPFPVPAAGAVPPPRPENAAAAGPADTVAPAPDAAAAAPAAGTSPQAAPVQVQAPPKPSLEDVEALTPESDFSRFIARDVDEKVKNSAMKKLFSDPHYNVMDGLDTYIDDYNTPDPLPKAMLRQLVQARMLGLLDDELPEQPAVEGVGEVADADLAPAAEEAAPEPAATADVGDAEVEVAAGPAPEVHDAAAAIAAPADPVPAGELQPVAGSTSSAS